MLLLKVTEMGIYIKSFLESAFNVFRIIPELSVCFFFFWSCLPWVISDEPVLLEFVKRTEYPPEYFESY